MDIAEIRDTLPQEINLEERTTELDAFIIEGFVDSFLTAIAQAREISASATATKKELEASDEYKQAVAAIKGAKALEEEARVMLNQLLVKYQELTDETEVGLLKSKEYAVFDWQPATLIPWLIDHKHHDALAVKWAEAKKLIQVLKPDCVTITQERRATIPSDLSELLEKEEEDEESLLYF